MKLLERRLFPWMMDHALGRQKVSRLRRLALRDAAGDVLEIGFGTGLNLAHYPEGVTRLTAVDVNPGMNRRALRRIAAGGIAVDHRIADATRLPLADGSFDTLVSTWTLCSVANLDAVLEEMRRVLRPGGRLLFVEHGLSRDPAVQRWQQRLNGLQRWIGAGCNLNRDFRERIPAGGFRLQHLREFYMEGDPRTHGYTYHGIARPV